MKPAKILYFLLSVFAALSVIMLVFPANGISVGKSFKLKFVSFQDVFLLEEEKHVDISYILAETNIETEDDFFNEEITIAPVLNEFSETEELPDNEQEEKPTAKETEKKLPAKKIKKEKEPKAITAFKKRKKPNMVIASEELFSNQPASKGISFLDIDKVLEHLYYPDDNKELLYPFFESLLDLLGGTEKQIRVLHYGDSQIEADRITSYLRYKFQHYFGGSGFGLLPAVLLPSSTIAVKQTNSKNWKRYTLFGRQPSDMKFRTFGAMSLFCRYTNMPKLMRLDSVAKIELDPDYEFLTYEDDKLPKNIHSAWVNYEISPFSYRVSRQISDCRLFYGFNNTPVTCRVYINDSLQATKVLEPNSSLQTEYFDWDKKPADITFEFIGKSSPNIYGISMEGGAGIYIDNIPMRGSSGLVFTKTDKKFLKDFYSELNAKLIILQVGGNVVPHMSKSYTWYKNSLIKQVKTIQEISPGVPILIIGLSDMSMKDGDDFVSYPVIEQVRKAEIDAAKETGCIFWDMYAAMGGENSMPSWVNAEPPLAEKDYIHLNPRGAKLIAQMLFNAIGFEYNEYLKDKGIINSNYVAKAGERPPEIVRRQPLTGISSLNKIESETLKAEQEIEVAEIEEWHFPYIIKEQGIFFSIQIGIFPNDAFKTDFKNLEPILVEQISENSYRYVYGKFEDIGEARKEKKRLKTIGFFNANIVAYRNGQLVEVNEAKKLISEENNSNDDQASTLDTHPEN